MRCSSAIIHRLHHHYVGLPLRFHLLDSNPVMCAGLLYTCIVTSKTSQFVRNICVRYVGRRAGAGAGLTEAIQYGSTTALYPADTRNSL